MPSCTHILFSFLLAKQDYPPGECAPLATGLIVQGPIKCGNEWLVREDLPGHKKSYSRYM